MNIKPICDCDENKIVTGQWNGEMVWRFKEFGERYPNLFKGQKVIDMSHTWKGDKDKEEEVYQANTD